MKDIDALEAQFRAALVRALRRPSEGLFALKQGHATAGARKLRTAAERIMELRQSYSVDRSETSAAALYIWACLKWEHGREIRSAKDTARNLLHALERGSHQL